MVIGKSKSDYNAFAEYLSGILEAGEVRNLSKRFQGGVYEDDPRKILDEIEDYLYAKWDENADASPRTGRADVQKKNFETFVKKQLLTREKLVYDNPYNSLKDKSDFSPLFYPYQEVIGELVVQPKGVNPRTQKLIKKLRPEVIPGEDIKAPKRSVYYNQFERQITISKKQGYVDNLVAIRNAMRDYPNSKVKPMEEWQARELWEKANEALRPYYKARGSLANNDKKDREETINILLGLNNHYRREDLDSKSTVYLESLEKTLNRSLNAPKKLFRLREDSIPTKKDELEKFLSVNNASISESLLEEQKEGLKRLYPFLDNKSLEEEALKKSAAKATNTPLFEEEVINRFMKWQYGETNKEPTINDLKKLSELTNNEFKMKISTEIITKKDPYTGSTRKIKDTLDKQEFSKYRTSLRDKINRAKTIEKEREEEQIRIFTEENERFE